MRASSRCRPRRRPTSTTMYEQAVATGYAAGYTVWCSQQCHCASYLGASVGCVVVMNVIKEARYSATFNCSDTQ